MLTLKGLPGRKQKEVRCHISRSITDALRNLRVDSATIVANDNGSISLWKDDDGQYRAEFYRFQCSEGEYKGETLAGLRDWLKSWWPKMSRD